MHVETATTGYSMKEEIVHSISHGIGALMSVVGLATLIMYSSMYGAALVPGGGILPGGSTSAV